MILLVEFLNVFEVEVYDNFVEDDYDLYMESFLEGNC